MIYLSDFLMNWIKKIRFWNLWDYAMFFLSIKIKGFYGKESVFKVFGFSAAVWF